MSRPEILKEILRLDPEKDNQRIVYLDSAYEFPFDTTRSLEFALFRTYAVPSIAAILDQTGEFGHRTQKRYDDTDLILSEIYEHGYDSERGRAALRRMNQQHGRHPISNDDFLYVMSTFIYEPIRWNARFGWRLMVENEKLAAFHFWRAVGRFMNIKSLPGPNDFDAFERFNVDYERNRFSLTESGARVGSKTRDLFLSWFMPSFAYPLGRPAIYAMLDDPLREAFGFPRPPAALRWLSKMSLVMRGRIVRLLPPRQNPRLKTQMRHRSYPHGYKIEELGPTIPVHEQTVEH